MSNQQIELVLWTNDTEAHETEEGPLKPSGLLFQAPWRRSFFQAFEQQCSGEAFA